MKLSLVAFLLTIPGLFGMEQRPSTILNKRPLQARQLESEAKKVRYDLADDLLFAVHEGNLLEIKRLVKLGAPLNYTDGEKEPPLLEAIHKNQNAVVELLCTLGANASIVKDVITPMLRAVYKGHPDIIRCLHANGANFDRQGHFGKTPLQLALQRIHGESEPQEEWCAHLVGALSALKLGAKMTKEDWDTWPLHQAAYTDHVEAFHYFLSLGYHSCETLDKNGRLPLYYAVKNGSRAVLNYLQSHWIVIGKQEKAAVIPDLVTTALHEGNNARGFVWLHQNGLASEVSPEQISHLLWRELTSTAPNLDTIHYLSYLGADVLASFGAHDPVHTLNPLTTPLHCAARMGKLEVIDYLLSKGAQIDAADSLGATPLVYAVVAGQVAAVKHLVRCGAKLQTSDADGNTPLHRSTKLFKHSLIMYETLCALGADIEAVNTQAKRADQDYEASKQIREFFVITQQLTAKNGVPESSAYLRAASLGFDVLLRKIHENLRIAVRNMPEHLRLCTIRPYLNYSDPQSGNTALHEAVSAGKAEAVRVLLHNPAVNNIIRNRAMLTPVELAQKLYASCRTNTTGFRLIREDFYQRVNKLLEYKKVLQEFHEIMRKISAWYSLKKLEIPLDIRQLIVKHM